MAVDFRVTAGVAAIVFAGLMIAQLFALPARRGETSMAKTSVLDDWCTVVSNRRFLAFSVAMIGSYVLSFQVHLALPLQAQFIAGAQAQILVSALFVVSGVVAVAGQLRITAWLRARWGSGRSLAAGTAVLAASFVPLMVVSGPSPFGTIVAVTALLITTALVAVGTAAVFPFEMDTVVALSGDKLVATHYGFYNTVVGVGILIGNLATGAVVGAARAADLDWAVWAGLAAIGAVAAYALMRMERADTAPTGSAYDGGRHQIPAGRQRFEERAAPARTGSQRTNSPRTIPSRTSPPVRPRQDAGEGAPYDKDKDRRHEHHSSADRLHHQCCRGRYNTGRRRRLRTYSSRGTWREARGHLGPVLPDLQRIRCRLDDNVDC